MVSRLLRRRHLETQDLDLLFAALERVDEEDSADHRLLRRILVSTLRRHVDGEVTDIDSRFVEMLADDGTA
jgi:hypothetical protein